MKSLDSKLPETGTSIFTIMSAMARDQDAINLAQGFPDFDCSEKLRAIIHRNLDSGHNQYAPMTGVQELRNALSDKVAFLYDCHIDAINEICITAGATQGLFTAIGCLINSGDEVIIFEPAYDSYSPSIRCFGGIAVPYVCRPPDFSVDWDQFENLITPKTRLIILNNPMNPTGKVFSDEDMINLERIVLSHGLFLLSDEVYEHLVYDGLAHQSVLKYPALLERSFLVYSFGKSLHATGWKIGYVVGREELMKEFRKIHQFNVFSVNSFMQYAIAEYIRDTDSYLSLSAFYQEKRDLLSQYLKQTRFKEIKCNGTYFQLYDYSAISNESDREFAIRLTHEYKVAVIPLSPFCSQPYLHNLVRICFAKTNEVLEKACSRLSNVR